MGYFGTLKAILLTPTAFPHKMLSSDGYLEPTLFALASSAISLVFWLLAGIIATLALDSWHIIAVVGIFSLANLLLLTPLLHLMTLLFHAVCKLLGGIGEYQETYRAIAYASAPIATTIIPLFHLVSGIWMLILQGIFLKEVHDFTDLRAILAVAITVLAYSLIAALIAGIAVMTYRTEVPT